MKKYTVKYRSAPTGYGWTAEYDRISEFENMVRADSREYTSHISVYDNKSGICIFRKWALERNIEIDKLHKNE